MTLEQRTLFLQEAEPQQTYSKKTLNSYRVGGYKALSWQLQLLHEKYIQKRINGDAKQSHSYLRNLKKNLQY